MHPIVGIGLKGLIGLMGNIEHRIFGLTAESAENTEKVNREILEIRKQGILTEGREGDG